ncbi:hypothetical protein KDD17_15605 [Sulfitobacter albidus]|uniref:Uncharacterized protein n=1 Tax=Sulfitobacter albidus TaxID=2829501 RepID=A0A975JDD8_9RHOB|nr:hypothetical protein [Sulfitobacter albidus]QUJ76302.1 hypothetical protein KDD17_15605 [Sulfitobacter albidus]
MMRPWIFGIGLALIGTTALAEALEVRSGDHASFSRLTLPLSNGTSWNAVRDGNRIRITIVGHADGFETASVFQRMQRTRVTDIETSDDTVTVSLACPCEAATLVSGGLLVIDVGDRDTALAGQPLGPAEPEAAVMQVRTPLTQPKAQTVLPWIGSGRSFPLPAQSASEPVAEKPIPDTPEDRTALLREISSSLASEVAAAASNGLLDVDVSAPLPRDADEPPSPTVVTATPPELTAADHGIGAHLRITDSMDRPSGNRRASGQDPICNGGDAYSVETFAGEGSFGAQISQRRDTLFNARDQLNHDAAIALAKTYIYFGFGAEALSVLRLDASIPPENAGLVALATILERGRLDVPNPLGNLSNCDGDVALWAVLGFKEIPTETQINTPAALRALNRLPSHLRQFLAPELSTRLLAYGDSGGAAAALRSVERLPEGLTPTGDLAKAALAMHNGAPAKNMLDTVINSNSERSPEALLKLVNATLAADRPLTYETATLVEAYAQELRGTEIGNQLRKTQVLAFSQSASFDEAFAKLETLLPALSLDEARSMREAVLVRLTDHADDFTFLDHIFAQDFDSFSDITTAGKIRLGERLMDLGFAAQVQRLMATVPDRPRRADRQLLSARAAIGLQQPFQALADLVEIEGPQAALLRAQATEMTGSYAEASALFEGMQANEEALRTALLSENWQDLISADAPAFGAATRVAAGQTSPAAAQDAGPLGLADAALTESAAARAALDTLLNDPILLISGGIDTE